MILNRTTLLSALAITAIAACANTASAHPRDNERRHNNYEHTLFHQQEASRRAVQDAERKERSERRLARFEQERRQYVRDYGIRSAEYRWFITRWERRWADAVARERTLMLEQRQAARRRHAQYHLDVNRYEYLSLSDVRIEHDLFTSGVTRFPGAGYDNDHRRPIVRRDGREIRRDRHPNVDWNIGVRVHN
jgi:hypothetical protein